MGVPAPPRRCGPGTGSVDRDHAARWRTALVRAVADHAAAHPLEHGLPVEAARQQLGLADSRIVTALLALPAARAGARARVHGARRDRGLGPAGPGTGCRPGRGRDRPGRHRDWLGRGRDRPGGDGPAGWMHARLGRPGGWGRGRPGRGRDGRVQDGPAGSGTERAGSGTERAGSGSERAGSGAGRAGSGAGQAGSGAGTELLLRDGGIAGAAAVAVPAEIRAAVEAVRADLGAAPFGAPEAHRLTGLGLGRWELAAAVRAGALLRVADGIYLLPGGRSRRGRGARRAAQPFTLSEARRALGTTRRVAVPLLELLDARGLTRRPPDDRRTARGRVRPGPE